MKAYAAFSESMISIDFDDPRDFTDVASRRMRYALYWAMYENTAYRDIHAWAKGYRSRYGLYKYIRNVTSPAYALGNFWRTHLWGGQLDTNAGDGDGVSSALPILIAADNPRADDLRAAIAALWQVSNWQIEKDIITLWGAVMGDTAIRVIDDTERGRVYLEKVHPGELAEVEWDTRGNVKHYRIERKAVDAQGQLYTYGETCTNTGADDVIAYETTRDGKPFGYDDGPAAWEETYGFVPLVTIQHDNVGLPWGWSEIHPQRSRMHEADDVASALGDHIRKSVNAPFLLAGVELDNSAITTATTAPTAGNPQPGRDETPFLYTSDPSAHADQLLAPMDYAGALLHLDKILAQIEREYPELRFDNMRVTGDASGKALRLARQPAEAKVRARRANYDNALTRLHAMAISIGAQRGYEDYSAFRADSYEAGELDHQIGDRPVFAIDELDRAEEEIAFWQAAQAATNAGLSLEGFLREHGWENDRISAALYGGELEQ